MAATSTSPVKILLDLGIDLDNLSSEENYLSALMEGAAAIESATKGKGDGRSAILREEVIRVRKGRKAADPNFKQRGQSFKITKKNISAQKLLTSSKEAKAQTEGGGDLLVIKEKVVAIEALLGEQYKLQEENAKDAKQEAEKKRRSLKERLLEGSGKVFDGVKKATNTVLKPFQSVWENIIGFIKKIILGRILFKILEWTSDPKNAGKIESIFKFLGDWWPALLAAYLVFGNGLSKFVIGLTGKLVVLGAKLVAKVIPALIKAAAAMGPWGAAALGVGAVVTGAVLGAKALDGDFSNKERTDEEKEADKEKADSAMDMGVLSMNKGGTVPGSGNTDTVPAMLTPGEFVMSKGAVQKYGSDTLAGMNAAAGGTNKPTLMGGYNEGGFANITNTETTSSSDSYGNFSVGKRYVAPGEAKERIAEMGMPSMELMDGTVIPDFGKMGGEKVTQGLQLTRDIMVENGASPERIAQLDEVMAMPDAQPESIALMINRLVPGSMENTMMNVGDSITSSARMNGGGLVQGFQGGGQVRRVQMGATSIKKIPEISPPITKPKVTVVNQPGTEEVDASQAQLPAGGNREIPSFDATVIRSSHKMEVLGISI
jgi:hypothetical protein